jgi:hypothetical protein
MCISYHIGLAKALNSFLSKITEGECKKMADKKPLAKKPDKKEDEEEGCPFC